MEKIKQLKHHHKYYTFFYLFRFRYIYDHRFSSNMYTDSSLMCINQFIDWRLHISFTLSLSHSTTHCVYRYTRICFVLCKSNSPPLRLNINLFILWAHIFVLVQYATQNTCTSFVLCLCLYTHLSIWLFGRHKVCNDPARVHTRLVCMYHTYVDIPYLYIIQSNGT